jgi:hypothetical protein
MMNFEKKWDPFDADGNNSRIESFVNGQPKHLAQPSPFVINKPMATRNQKLKREEKHS